MTSRNANGIVNIIGLQPSGRTEEAQRQCNVDGCLGHDNATRLKFDIHSPQIGGRRGKIDVDRNGGPSGSQR